jgi:hypothetical protein
MTLMVAAASVASALAQPTYPVKPARIIVTSTPAGVLNNVARTRGVPGRGAPGPATAGCVGRPDGDDHGLIALPNVC